MSLESQSPKYAPNDMPSTERPSPVKRSSGSKSKCKDRRAFTAAEDAALRAGYQAHGTAWARIARDPVFQAANGGLGRRSTDLRDRFRNAWPKDYEREGYKPRRRNKRPSKSTASGSSSISSSVPDGKSPNERAAFGQQPRGNRIVQYGSTSPASIRGGGRSLDYGAQGPLASQDNHVSPYTGQVYPQSNWGHMATNAWQFGSQYADPANATYGLSTHSGNVASPQESGSGSASGPTWYGIPESAQLGTYGSNASLTGSGSASNVNIYGNPHLSSQQSSQRALHQQQQPQQITPSQPANFPVLSDSSFHSNASAGSAGGTLSSYYQGQWYPTTDAELISQAAAINDKARNANDLLTSGTGHSTLATGNAYPNLHSLSSFSQPHQSSQRSRGSSTGRITSDSSLRGSALSSTLNVGGSYNTNPQGISSR